MPHKNTALARRLKQAISTYQQNRDLIAIGSYQKGSYPRIDAAIALAIAETGAASPKDMGKVMKAVMPKLAGKNAEGRAINEAVRRKLGA